MTTPMEYGCVRRWKHKKLYRKNDMLMECNVRGFILPLRRIMFVDISSHDALSVEDDFEATRFIWSDLDDLELDNLENGTEGLWKDDDWANVFFFSNGVKIK